MFQQSIILKKKDFLPNFYPRWMIEASNYFEENFLHYLENSFNIPYDIREIIKFSLFPGRRIRPALYCTFWKDLYEDFPKGIDLRPVYALELFHAASIIVDDIIDQDEQRRNKEVLYKKVGVGKASLTSHLLVSLGFKLISTSRKSKSLTRICSECYNESSIGEYADISRLSNYSIEEQSSKALEKTKGFFTFIGKSLRLYSKINHDIVKLFGILGESYQVSNDFHDFLSVNKNGRYLSGKKYKLNYSAVIPELIRHKIVSEDTLKSPITYKELSQIVLNARKILGSEDDILASYIESTAIKTRELKLPYKLRSRSIEFLDLLGHPKFWTHIH